MLQKLGGQWYVGIYLVFVTTVLIIVLIFLWPDELQNNSLTKYISKSEAAIEEIIKQDSTLSIRGNFSPDITSVINDTVNFRISIISDSSVVLDTTIVYKPIVSKIPEHMILLLILLVGALGACLHGLTSIAEYIGNNNFKDTWVLWYLLRPVVGGVLAVVFYIIIRAGFLPQVENTDSFYILVALAGLTGLFSKQALYKLSDLFDTIFQSKKQDELKDKLIPQHPVPNIKSIIPKSVNVNSQNLSISISGSHFIEDSVVKVNDNDCETDFIDAKNLKAKLDDSWLKLPTELEVEVMNPEPGGGHSNLVKLIVK